MGPLTLLLGALAAVALVGSAAGAAVMAGDGDEVALPGSGDGPAEGSGRGAGVPENAPDEWDERVVDLAEFVEDERGLDFEHPVEVQFLDEDEFREEVALDEGDLTDEDLEDIEDAVPQLRALGLVSGDIDLVETLGAQMESSTLAFYDTDEVRVVVPSTGDLTISDEVTLVHELTHALQDQHFDLDRMLDEDDAEAEDEAGGEGTDEDGDGGEEGTDDGTEVTASSYVSALVEGDANRIATAYVETLSQSDVEDYVSTYQDELDEYVEATESADIPSFLQTSMQIPYTLGEALAGVVAAEGGNAAVDRAFDDPPSTGSHLLEPTSYVEGEEPAELDPPDLPDGVDDTVDEGEFDALDLYLVLAERTGPVEALEAADAWDGGRYRVYEDGDRTCFRIHLAAEGGPDGPLADSLDGWAEAMPEAAGTEVVPEQDGEPALVTTCDPGPDPDLPNDRSEDTLALAYFRASTVWQLMEYARYDVDEARDASTCIARQSYEEGLTSPEEWSDESSEAFLDIMTSCGA